MMDTAGGRGGENIAEAYLAGKGATILARNYKAVGGEIDLITRFEDRIVFVEVKVRRGMAYGTPGDAITPAKAARIRRAATMYLKQNGGCDQRVRFDALLISPEGVKHIRGAF